MIGKPVVHSAFVEISSCHRAQRRRPPRTRPPGSARAVECGRPPTGGPVRSDSGKNTRRTCGYETTILPPQAFMSPWVLVVLVATRSCPPGSSWPQPVQCPRYLPRSAIIPPPMNFESSDGHWAWPRPIAGQPEVQHVTVSVWHADSELLHRTRKDNKKYPRRPMCRPGSRCPCPPGPKAAGPLRRGSLPGCHGHGGGRGRCGRRPSDSDAAVPFLTTFISQRPA